MESPRTHLNHYVSTHTRDELRKAISGQEIQIEADKGQSSLLAYLCVNNGVNPSGYCIHHINFNHKDYRFENICVITPKQHAYLHKVLVSECINKLLEHKGITTIQAKKKLTDADISKDDIEWLSTTYMEEALKYIDANKIDSGFPIGG